MKPRVVMLLSENWTMSDPRNLRDLVRQAREAEDAGIDAVMMSEHIALGPSAEANGPMANPRDYAMPGNQSPFTPWPSSLIMLAAMAAVTTRLRLFAVAVIPPLRHPLHLAKELATLDLLSEGRLVALPTVSWHRDEYAALGVPFEERGRRLDEHLDAWRRLWAPSPASFRGKYYGFDDVYCEPKPFRVGGPHLHFGSDYLHDHVLERLVRYGTGWNPLGAPTAAEVDRLHAALRTAGRDPSEIELVGGTRGEFPVDGGPADLGRALEPVPEKLAAGFTTICIKPSQFIDDPHQFGPFCRDVARRFAQMV